MSVLFFGCTKNNDEQKGRLKKVTIQSEILGKDMISQVYLPENYNNAVRSVSYTHLPVKRFAQEPSGK